MSFTDPFGLSHYHFHYKVQRGDTLSRIILNLYGQFNDINIPVINQSNLNNMIAIFMHNNPQIKDPNLISTGMSLDVSPFKQHPMSIYPTSDRLEMDHLLTRISQGQMDAISSNISTLQWLWGHTKEVSGGLYGMSGTLNAVDGYASALQNGAQNLEKALNQIDFDSPMSSNSIKNQLTKGLKNKEAMDVFNGMSKDLKTKILRESYPKTGSINNTLKIPNNIKASHVEKLIQGSQSVQKSMGYLGRTVSYGAPIVLGGFEIYRADEGQRVKVTVKVSSGIIVGAWGSTKGALGAIAVCGVLGVATGGLAMVACGIGGAMIGGSLGDYAGRELAGELYDVIPLQ